MSGPTRSGREPPLTQARGLTGNPRFVVVPVVLGGGPRLFAEGPLAPARSLTLTTILEDGAIGLHDNRA
jgi:hypothetical protein